MVHLPFTYPGNSELIAIGLFQVVWNFLKLFGFFNFWCVQCGIFVHLDLETLVGTGCVL